jgi:hypothetical protein
MRRGTPFALKLARIALAYALALQTLLGAFAGLAVAANSGSIDPALTLCRTVADGEAQQPGDGNAPVTHCALMCLSGACAAGDPPAAASATMEFPPLRAAFASVPATDNHCSSPGLRSGLNARGPPSIG